MDHNQTKIIELPREVHLLAIKEVERLNLRITELENQDRRLTEKLTPAMVAKEPLAFNPAAIKQPGYTYGYR